MGAIKAKSKRKSKLKVRTILGTEVEISGNGWVIKDEKAPVNKRFYHGDKVDYKKLNCFDSETGKYINVEHFQPVIYDLDSAPPTYNPKWEVYDGTGKNKKLLRIDFPPSYMRYWEKQLIRCVDGYEVGGVYLTGPYYFFLNFWRIKGKKVGSGYIVPRFLDVGKMFFDYVQQAQDEEKNVMFLKRRQIGCSEMCAAVAAWYFTFQPASENMIIAGEGAYAENTMQKCRVGLSEFSRFSGAASADPFYKRLMKDTLEETISGWKENGSIQGFKSRLLCVTVKDNIQRASGKSPTLVIMEEAGRFQHLKAVYNMVLPSIQEGGLQNGRIIIFIGTGGEMEKGVAEMQEFFYKPEINNLLAVSNTWDKDVTGSKSSVFFPAWLYYVTDKDGNSYKDIGVFLIMEQREIYKSDLKSLHTYKTQMPLNPAEAFTASGLSPFNVEKLSAQRTKILANNWEDIRQYGKLDWVTNGKGVITGVKWTAADDPSKLDHEGDLMYPYLILEHPRVPERVNEGGLIDGTRNLSDPSYVNLYHGGTDPYDKDEAVGGGSKGSCSIFKGVNEENVSGDTSMIFVARLTWRPSKAKKFYEATAKLCVYYNAENLIEYSNVGIFSWYEDNGWGHYLKERPLLAQSVFKNSQVNNKFGIDPQTRPYWINNYAAYIEDYYANLFDLEQVQRAIGFRRKGLNGKKHNDDITDGAMLAYQHYLDNKMRRFRVGETKKKKKGRPLFGTIRGSNGSLIKVA